MLRICVFVDVSVIVLQVLSKEREIQRTREIKEDFSSRINDVSEKLKAVSAKFKEKSPDVDHAKEEVKVGDLTRFTVTCQCLLCSCRVTCLISSFAEPF